MNRSKIGVLGAGWLGGPLIKELLNIGYQVNAGSRTRERLNFLPKRDGLQLFEIDIQPNKIIGDITGFLDIDLIIINIPPNRNAAGEQFYKLVEAINNSRIRQVIFVSSTSVYAPLNQVLEEDEGMENPESTLYQSEVHFKKMGLPTTILRFAGLMGPKRYPGRFFRGKPVIKAGNTPVNMLHLNDAVGVIRAVLEANCPSGIFNVCASTHPSRKAFYTKAMQLKQLDIPKFIEEGSLPLRTVSNHKIIQKLGYTFEVDDLLGSLEQDGLFF